jgi:hypothetical protein
VSTVQASDRIIGVHIGESRGFVEGSQLSYKESASAGDCNGLMSADSLEKWGKE